MGLSGISIVGSIHGQYLPVPPSRQASVGFLSQLGFWARQAPAKGVYGRNCSSAAPGPFLRGLLTAASRCSESQFGAVRQAFVEAEADDGQLVHLPDQMGEEAGDARVRRVKTQNS